MSKEIISVMILPIKDGRLSTKSVKIGFSDRTGYSGFYYQKTVDPKCQATLNIREFAASEIKKDGIIVSSDDLKLEGFSDTPEDSRQEEHMTVYTCARFNPIGNIEEVDLDFVRSAPHLFDRLTRETLLSLIDGTPMVLDNEPRCV